MIPTLSDIPETARYVHALTVVEERITPIQHELLSRHWYSPGHVATASELARKAGLSGYRAVNSHYGRLGKLLRGEMNYFEPGQQSWIISSFARLSSGEWTLHMHPQLADALLKLGWVGSDISEVEYK